MVFINYQGSTVRALQIETFQKMHESFITSGNIVGQLSAADVDGDGYSEVFVPGYFKDRMFVYTFKPE